VIWLRKRGRVERGREAEDRGEFWVHRAARRRPYIGRTKQPRSKTYKVVPCSQKEVELGLYSSKKGSISMGRTTARRGQFYGLYNSQESLSFCWAVESDLCWVVQP